MTRTLLGILHLFPLESVNAAFEEYSLVTNENNLRRTSTRVDPKGSGRGEVPPKNSRKVSTRVDSLKGAGTENQSKGFSSEELKEGSGVTRRTAFRKARKGVHESLNSGNVDPLIVSLKKLFRLQIKWEVLDVGFPQELAFLILSMENSQDILEVCFSDLKLSDYHKVFLMDMMTLSAEERTSEILENSTGIGPSEEEISSVNNTRGEPLPISLARVVLTDDELPKVL